MLLNRGTLRDIDIPETLFIPVFPAALDVFETEPVTAKTYGDSLFTLPNLIVQPHVGASTIEVTRDSTVTAVETAHKYCRGQGIGTSTLVRELEWSDLARNPSRTQRSSSS